jgi:ABC-type multidrug transport system fused ATPase/permease subunit
MNFNHGRIYSVLVSDSNAVYSAVSVTISIIFTVLNVFGIGLTAACINWQLCIVLILPYPLTIFINHKFRKVIKDNAVDVVNQNDEYINHVKNMAENIYDIKNQNGTSKILQKVCGEAAKGRDLSIRQMMAQTTFDGLVSATGMLGHIALTITGVYYVYMGIIPFGTFVAFNNYSKSLSSSIDVLVNVKTNLQPLMVSIERVLEIEELSRKSAQSEHAKKATVKAIDSLCFKNVSLSYGENEILHHISLSLQKGKVTGFIGKNGSGKTSIMNLIMRNILPTEGEILFNEIPAERYSYFSLRKHFEYIGVKRNLYHLSLYDNITLSDDGLFAEETTDKIKQACEEIGLLQDIYMLADAFNTQVQDEYMFSTGQAKKIQIARAFIKDSNVMIFDEALSNLDDETRKSVAVKLKQLAESKIIILISHNIEDYSICDEIYQIENGRLERVGQSA